MSDRRVKDEVGLLRMGKVRGACGTILRGYLRSGSASSDNVDNEIDNYTYHPDKFDDLHDVMKDNPHNDDYFTEMRPEMLMGFTKEEERATTKFDDAMKR